jgi:hypothetical protein
VVLAVDVGEALRAVFSGEDLVGHAECSLRSIVAGGWGTILGWGGGKVRVKMWVYPSKRGACLAYSCG